MVPGTIVQEGALILRRRPHATIGLPWKSRGGVRYDHSEVAILVCNGATVSFCETCAQGQLCLAHDQAHLPTGSNTPAVGQ